jgi:hypothetical protein
MQGEINGPILGIDTITTVKGTKSAVVQVMKIYIDAENIDWDQAPDPNPDLAMIAFTELFYLPLELGTRVTISGPVQVRLALPPNAQKKFQTQIKLANHQLKIAFEKWIKRNKFTDHNTQLENLLTQLLNEQINLNQFYTEVQTEAYGHVEKSRAIDKLRHALRPALETRWRSNHDAPTVLWFQQAENIEIQDSLDEPDNGPLTVIRLDEGSVKDKWAEWEKKMAQAQK